jgi:NAD(P)-dependent dehydrogenase (short-subunit alcohol dehydrogenase family)
VHEREPRTFGASHLRTPNGRRNRRMLGHRRPSRIKAECERLSCHMRLAGRTALITGAASGIGKAVVEAFVSEGAQVISADIIHTTNSLQAASNPRNVCLDVRREDAWEQLSEVVGDLDVLVACAGISEARPVSETSLSDWQRVMSVNLDGAFLSVKYGAKAMRKCGGSVVLIGSASGVKAAAGASAYCASKAALRMLAKAAALELKAQGIRVNSVSPAAVVTPMWQKMPFWADLVEKHGGEEGAWNALGGCDPATPSTLRMAFPEEVAAAVVFLSCDDSAHITGLDLLVDGGYTL